MFDTVKNIKTSDGTGHMKVDTVKTSYFSCQVNLNNIFNSFDSKNTRFVP